MHAVPAPQLAAHLQVPPTHEPEVQSPSAPQAAPSAHEGAQLGEAHFPPVHICDEQLIAPLHGLPSGQSSPHSAQTPLTQREDIQSESLVHASLGAQGKHAATQMPFKHSPDAQSVSAPHAASSAQLGEHGGGAQTPSVHVWEMHPLGEVHESPGHSPGGHV